MDEMKPDETMQGSIIGLGVDRGRITTKSLMKWKNRPSEGEEHHC